MELPFMLGSEGQAGSSAVGDEVSGFAVGDRIAWWSVLGSYAGARQGAGSGGRRGARRVGLDVAAAVMLQGMMAHYLALDTFPLHDGHRCLVHAGAGGVGLLLIQIAKLRGAEVFATVGSEAKAELAQAAGADHVIVYADTEFGAAVERIADQPLDVVYDGVGQATFDRGLDLLRRRGMMVSFGNASGAVEPIPPPPRRPRAVARVARLWLQPRCPGPPWPASSRGTCCRGVPGRCG